ncbi:hypothetical protein D0Z03_002498 [Geotrichum reessii]|nr:hypothetical protein D0Z03_002498 [Galactomyces reessii]
MSSSNANGNKNEGNKARKTFLKFWAIPTVTTVILWSAFRRSSNSEDQEEHVAKPAQPWKVAAYSTLPLKALSRWWGKFNDIDLPIWMREPGYKLYSYFFGVNLDEVAEDDLTTYKNLGEFFYRKLKPGARIIDENSPLVSPADGKILHLGIINDGQVEQVKGITYSLDALLGSAGKVNYAAPSHHVNFDETTEEIIERHKEFAVVNNISYTVDDLIGGSPDSTQVIEDQGDATENAVSSSTVAKVAKDLYSGPYTPVEGKELFFTVIYLAPGDYHRFHSPTNWVSELRRHFAGELYSVAPYFQNRLSNLFVLNERIALLGKWKYGFFSMTPVGATNVGSICLHFDKDLTTNTVYESPITSDAESTSSASSTSSKKRVQKATCYEATYQKASPLLKGYPILKGQEMGGFKLGSTVVLVFEAPKNFKFKVKKGEVVRVGQSLGDFEEDTVE